MLREVDVVRKFIAVAVHRSPQVVLEFIHYHHRFSREYFVSPTVARARLPVEETRRLVSHSDAS